MGGFSVKAGKGAGTAAFGGKRQPGERLFIWQGVSALAGECIRARAEGARLGARCNPARRTATGAGDFIEKSGKGFGLQGPGGCSLGQEMRKGCFCGIAVFVPGAGGAGHTVRRTRLGCSLFCFMFTVLLLSLKITDRAIQRFVFFKNWFVSSFGAVQILADVI